MTLDELKKIDQEIRPLLCRGESLSRQAERLRHERVEGTQKLCDLLSSTNYGEPEESAKDALRETVNACRNELRLAALAREHKIRADMLRIQMERYLGEEPKKEGPDELS